MTETLRKYIFPLVVLLSVSTARGQTDIADAGFFSGIVIPITWDTGIDKDSRYQPRYDVKFSPIGFHLGIDKLGYGYTIDPMIFNTGQYFHLINTSGGQVGTRKIDLTYAQVPFGFKIHLIDLEFFKISLITSVGVSYLVKGEETISHDFTRLHFPTQVYPILPEDYIIEYDGVISPMTESYTMLEKKDFKGVQIFGGLGLRSDWDFSYKWRAFLDFRVNYGILEPRTSAYKEKVKNYETLYDMYGQRHDMYAGLQLGISRTIEIEHKKEIKKSVLHDQKPAGYSFKKPAWSGTGASKKAKAQKTSKRSMGAKPSKNRK